MDFRITLNWSLVCGNSITHIEVPDGDGKTLAGVKITAQVVMIKRSPMHC